jgi:hypothetical protein
MKIIITVFLSSKDDNLLIEHFCEIFDNEKYIDNEIFNIDNRKSKS